MKNLTTAQHSLRIFNDRMISPICTTAILYVRSHCLHYRCTHVAVILTCPRNPHERLGTQYSE